MSQLILPARLKAQPRGHFEIAQGDPLTRGLIGAFPLASDFDDRVHGLVPSVVSPLPFSVPPSSGVATNWRAPNFSSGNLTFNPTKLAPQVSGNFSLSFWANIASQSRYNDIFVTSFGSGLYVQLGNGDIIVNIGDNTGTFLTNFYVSPTGFGTNKWMHFVVTVAPTVCHVYFNGVDQGANAISGGIPVLIASGFTGAIGNESNHCDGAISNLLLYDRTLPKSEAIALYRDPQQVFRKQRRLFFASGSPATNALTGTADQHQAAAGQLSIAVPLHAVALQAQAGKASISVSVPLSGYATAKPQADGSLSVSVPLAASSVQEALARAVLSLGVPLTGASLAVAQASGQMRVGVPLAGAGRQQQGVTAALSVHVTLAGEQLQQAIAAATLTNTPAGDVALQGSSSQAQAAHGSLSVGKALQGASLAVSAGRGALGVAVPLSGASVQAHRATGALGVSVSLRGEALQETLARATLANVAPIDLSGASAAQQAGAGTLLLQIHLSADSVQQVGAVATLGVSTIPTYVGNGRYYAAARALAFYAAPFFSAYAAARPLSFYGSA